MELMLHIQTLYNKAFITMLYLQSPLPEVPDVPEREVLDLGEGVDGLDGAGRAQVDLLAQDGEGRHARDLAAVLDLTRHAAPHEHLEEGVHR